MTACFLFALMIFGVLIAFARSRKNHEKRLWNNQTNYEKALLALVSAGVFQFLFLMPGWIVAVSVVGYNGNKVTPLENCIFGMVMLLSNTVIYFPIFYLLFGWILKYDEKRR